jgi:membrane associated rhomboid family serine protease
VSRAVDVCYRHPKRETGVRCSNCDRPICPDCMTSTSVGMRCPECARQSTKVRTMRTMTDEPVLTYLLIGINVLVGIGSLLGGGAGADSSSLTDDGGVSQATIAGGDYWRLITAGFLHAGPFHLLTNMLALWILGSMIEPAMGKWRFGLVYFVSLLCGSFGALLLSPDSLTVGASGAVFGLMGAAAIVARNRGFSLMESGLGIWIGLNLLITFTIPNISVGGHIGGLVGGSVAAFLLLEMRQRARLPEVVPALVCGAIAAAAVVASIVVSG